MKITKKRLLFPKGISFRRMIYTSRFSNPELKTGNYTAVRISVGSPRWNLGYTVNGAISELTPKGIFGKYETKAAFEIAYRKRLNCVGVEYIRKLLRGYELLGKDVALLCYEDVRKGDSDWCHRTMFADWWREKTGEVIPELYDPSPVKGVGKVKKPESEQTMLSGF